MGEMADLSDSQLDNRRDGARGAADGNGENIALEVTRDAFLGGQVEIAQPKSGHRAGIDAVLLAASVSGVNKEPMVLDVGAGPGTVGLLVAHRIGGAQVTGVEIEPQLVALASDNIAANALSARMTMVEADVCRPFRELEPRGLVANLYDRVISNPPFYDEDRCRVSANDLKRRANSIAPGGLEKWIKFMTTSARADGELVVIYPGDRLVDLLDCLDGRFGALEVFPIFPRECLPAIRVIVRGRKGSRAPLKIHRGLVMHEAEGAFTQRAKGLLSGGCALEFDEV